MMRFYNTLSRCVEDFVPLHPPEVLLYTCGPTVYHYAHLGNLRGFIFYDLLKRALSAHGYVVKHVMNITDVGHLTDDADDGEDKMEKGSRREGKSVWDIARFYTEAFLADAHALHILPPTYQPKATEYIQEQIALIQRLEAKGYTYRTRAGIVFDTSLFPTYHLLSGMKADQLKVGARVEVDPEKRHPTDFYLWKFSFPEDHRQMEWNSPWGVGFPGWHIECSAMAFALLGESIDIHCGGIDHIPVHHTNEIAQSEAASGKQFARFWLHNNFLVLRGGQKMAKSGDNFYTLSRLRDLGFEPLAFRYMVLTAHYRSELEFSIESLHNAQNTLHSIRSHLRGNSDFIFDDSVYQHDSYLAFMEAINDDLNTPAALSIFHSVLKSHIPLHEKLSLIVAFDSVLGLGFADCITQPVYLSPEEVFINQTPLSSLLAARATARAEQRWEDADAIRQYVLDHGFVIEDTPEGQRVKSNRP